MKNLLLLLVSVALGSVGCSMNDPGKLDLNGTWLFKIDSLDRGFADGWYKSGVDRSSWQTQDLPNYWDRYDLASYDGLGWYARTFEWKNVAEPMSIFFGGVDDDADVWINGVNVGSHVGYSDAFYFDVTKALKAGTNEVVVRVRDLSGPGGIYKPVTLIQSKRIEELLRSKYASMTARKSEEWVREAVIYEVYLRSFSKEGTFKGLERRIPELKQLGVTVVWLMPIHPVGELNRKGNLGSPYSVRDYYGVNPEFGTLDDFKSLVKTVHANGMKIIIDLVANHTAWDNKMLMEHPDWYTHNAEGAIVSPNPDWHDVADLNYDHHELRKYMIEMMEYWVRDIGIDGFRCDVAELVPTDFWEVARGELDKIKPIMMLSEGTLPEHHLKAFDLTYSWNLYDVFDKVIHGTTPVSIFDMLLKSESYQFPKGSLRLRFNTNHDKNAWDNPAVVKFGRDGAKATAVLAFTYPGVPLIYNGEEVGSNQKLDLFDKVDIDWSKNRDFRRLYEQLTQLRREHPAFVVGEYIPVSNSDSVKVYTFARRTATDHVVVAINFSSKPKVVTIAAPFRAESWQEYFAGKTVASDGMKMIALGPMAFEVFIALNK